MEGFYYLGNIINSDNEILQLFFDEDKWDTILEKRVKDYGTKEFNCIFVTVVICSASTK